MKERHVAEAFERGGITAPERARDPQEIGVRMHGIGWRRLVDRAVVREASPGKWYIDMPSWLALRRQRRRMSIILVILVIAVAAFTLLGKSHP
ncbi:MAG: hypothetical protein ABI446_03575 [Gemmatimonadaceae bacterium]